MKDQRGVALVLALFALVVLGGLAGASFVLARQQRLLGRNLLRLQQASAMAENAASEVVLAWPNGPYNGLEPGEAVVTSGSGPDGWYRSQVLRLGPGHFRVIAQGLGADSTSRQLGGLLLRLRPLPLSFNAAFTAAGGVVLGPSAVIQGTDAAPEAWPDCPAPGPSVPPLAESGPAASGAGVPLDSLRDFATKVVRGGVLRIEPRLSPSGCDAADPFNWGDPENPHSPCGDYFPVIWVDGNATLYGVRGQGILLVSGDLNLRGGFVFYGGVRIGGMLTSEGSGGWIVGAASAEGDSARSSLMGDGGIRYSSCALSRALTESAGAEPLPSRAWVAVY